MEKDGGQQGRAGRLHRDSEGRRLDGRGQAHDALGLDGRGLRGEGEEEDMAHPWLKRGHTWQWHLPTWAPGGLGRGGRGKPQASPSTH